MKIISGGQTGVDLAALDAAIANKIEYGGYIIKDGLNENGVVSDHYNLIPLQSNSYAKRTRKNVEASDATLIIALCQDLNGGTKLTRKYCEELNKPCLVYCFDNDKDLIQFLKYEMINVAGPRESKCPGIYQKTFDLLNRIFNKEVKNAKFI